MSNDFNTTKRYFNLADAHKGGVSATLVVIRGEPFGKAFDLGLKPMTIGRSNSCDLQFGEDSVSRRQCQVAFDGEGYNIVDLQSTNRTQVNGDNITQCRLKDGDRISFGRVVLKFVASDPIESAYHNEVYARASSDPLTGVANRRVFEESLDQTIASYPTAGTPLSLAIVDLDLFKDVNDRYGHLAGDYVLKKVTDILKRQEVKGDLIARLGGEEFGVMLPDSHLALAAERMESLRLAVARAPLLVEGDEIKITVSAGVAEFEPQMRNRQGLMRAADEALFEAKASGRNCVRMSPPT